MEALTLLILVIILALIFDFINGFHDSANSIATIVSTRVLTPFQAVLWAGFFNFVAFWISDLKVADTVSKTVDAGAITLPVIFSGLIAAIIWNLLTWWWGIPSSSSHTLMGGFAGAAIAHAGWGVVNGAVMQKTFLFIFLAPIIGMLLSYIISVIMLWTCRSGHPSKLDKWFKRLQLASSALFSIGHGGNDAQKVMGIIAAALIVFLSGNPDFGNQEWTQLKFKYEDEVTKAAITIPEGIKYAEYKAVYFQETGHKLKEKIKEIPYWVVIGCYTAIALGTIMGGWRIVKTMGTKITKMTPFEGVAAETAGALTLFGTQTFGIPTSTTHTITGSIIGVGLTKRVSAVKWGVTGKLLIAWIITIPISAIVGAITLYICELCGLQ
jgi:inorganic phosphate transporter, PiT family